MSDSLLTAGSGYDQDAAFFEDVNADRGVEINFYRQMLEGYGTLLDVGCGTGQITRHLTIGRERTLGVDNSRGMLDKARSSPPPEGSGELVYLEAAMPHLNLGERFDACVSTFNTFQHLLTWQDALAFLRSVRAHLRPGGIFVFDIFNPCFDFLEERRGPVFKKVFPCRASGVRIELSELTAYDRATQINHIEYIYKREGEGEAIMTHRFTMRQYFPQELALLLHQGGFEVEHWLGDFDHSPFIGTSPRQIPICRPHPGE